MPTPADQHKTAHQDLHSERGAEPGDRTDRARNPVIKVEDLAWLEFEKPDLDRAERFARDFGLTTAARTPDTLYLRGARRGDLQRLAAARDTLVTELTSPGGGYAVELHDPAGAAVRVVADAGQLPDLPITPPLTLNFGETIHRANTPQRPALAPAQVLRLGHVVLETPSFGRCLDWYLHNLELIVSDFLYFPGQRERGPTMAFIRCDRAATPADHHTLAMHLGPARRYVHSAFQVTDLDAVAAGGRYLAEHGYDHAWGIGRHIQGSQIFDYWRDPDRLMVEHFADGDVFDSSIQAGWAPMTASGLAQWGPPVTRDFLDAKPSPRLIRQVMRALRDPDNEFDFGRLTGLLKVMSS